MICKTNLAWESLEFTPLPPIINASNMEQFVKGFVVEHYTQTLGVEEGQKALVRLEEYEVSHDLSGFPFHGGDAVLCKANWVHLLKLANV